MGIFVSIEKTVECLLVAMCYALLLTFASYKTLGILQSYSYHGRKVVEWSHKKSNMLRTRLHLLAIACVLSSGVLGLCFSFLGKWCGPISLVAYVIFFALFYYSDSKVALRSPMVFTPRMVRLSVALWFVYALACYVLVTLLNAVDYLWGNALFSSLKYCLFAVMPLLIVYFVCFANVLMKIYEVPHNNAFINRAKERISSSGVKVIGVTGSFGKTSVKNILTTILNKKFKVLATPRSHNTPLGIALTANNHVIENYDVFIAEMGARHLGDIAELCDICTPDISVITGICEQHLESFYSIENIIKGKGEIIEATRHDCFIAPDCYELFSGYGDKAVNADCFSDVVSTCHGTDFTLTLGGESRRLHTVLLGEHSAKNICLCAKVAYELGMTMDEICSAIDDITFVEHRLQLIEADGVNVLDDGYNSNVRGAEAAINVLKTFEGRKIVVTPGLVELGVLEKSENIELGKKLVGLDRVILVGETLVGCVKEGYLSNGGDESKLVTVPDLFSAQDKLKEILAKGDTVLFLNDLPDKY